MSESKTSLFRARILGAVGTSLLVASACGGDSSSDTPGTGGSGGAGTGGVATGGSGGAGTGGGGIGGSAGSTTGGVAGVGAGGVAGSAPDGGKNCLTSEQIAGFCAPSPDGGYTAWSCWGLGQGPYMDAGGPWVPGDDAGTECPDSIRPNNGADCSSYTQGEAQNGECCYVYNPGGGGCGRPFLVDGHARRAPAVVRSDWLAECNASSVDLAETTRLALAEAWLEDARLEHASVASFARFTLELLGLGAPSDLVADAQRAAGDEVEHARLCFALASRYGGQNVGPGPLSLDGSLGTISLVDAAARTAREGCVGETLAAFVASEQLDRATDPDVRSALSRIAEDEADHAELAWRFVAWAIATGGESVRRAVAAEFGAAIDEIRRATPSAERDVDSIAFAAHGRLNAREQRAAELHALAEIIEPSAKALTSCVAKERIGLQPLLI